MVLEVEIQASIVTGIELRSQFTERKEPQLESVLNFEGRPGPLASNGDWDQGLMHWSRRNGPGERSQTECRRK